jgi:excisionase family DNA binding protein
MVGPLLCLVSALVSASPSPLAIPHRSKTQLPPAVASFFYSLARPKTQELAMQALDEIERFFSIADTCRILGCERSTVYARIKQGRLRAVRIDGSKRIPRSELLRIISAAQPVAA